MSLEDLNAPGIKEEFINLLTTHCNFVRSEDEVTSGALFVYGKNAPVRLLLERHHRTIQRRSDKVLVSESIDYECTFEGRYTLASSALSKAMDRKIREPHKLHLYKGARYRITTNKPGTYSNGQLAFLANMPCTG
jgi:hypothetical protein